MNVYGNLSAFLCTTMKMEAASSSIHLSKSSQVKYNAVVLYKDGNERSFRPPYLQERTPLPIMQQTRWASGPISMGPENLGPPPFPRGSNIELLYLHKNLLGFTFHNFGNLT